MNLLNKKADGTQPLSIFLIIVISIVTIGIVAGVYVFSSANLNTKSLEADVLAVKIADCFVKNGNLANIDEKEVFSSCNLDEKTINSLYYFEIKIYDAENCDISKLENCKFLRQIGEFGNKKLKQECEITSNAEAENYPACAWKIISALSDGKNIFVYIYAGSNQQGGKI